MAFTAVAFLRRALVAGLAMGDACRNILERTQASDRGCALSGRSVNAMVPRYSAKNP
jgi:hypothetical protein